MNEQVILNIKGYPIKVNLILAKKTSHTYHYCFGEISLRVSNRLNLNKIQHLLEKVFSEKVLSQLNPEPFFTEDYVYVLGEKTKLFLKEDKDLEFDNIYVENALHKKVKLKSLLLEIVTDRVRYYEQLMGLGMHTIKVKRLISILGNNHYKKKILNFNQQLIHFSLELIDSVVVHELCHDYYQNHSHSFYEKVEKYCQDYETKRYKLVCGVRK